ncbi:MAG TPA: hypothetical protein DDZ80_00085 [Cyanobacteria bacterium UBA8803]|nr:hypothetical protein [Cyanobacteria bacterium UBA9273]HBL57016.1 hypothetical protein [Cyanobacteria bacterium UBA8803]
MKSLFKGIKYQGWLIGSLALAMSLGWSQPIRAEGSRELIANGGSRPFLEFRNAASSGIQRRTIIKVFANAGETINLASSATGLDPDGAGVLPPANIRYRSPDGTSGTCGPGVGLIANRDAEAAGPGAGYVPCQVLVGANLPGGFGAPGVWEIQFLSPDPGNGANPPVIAANLPWTQPTTVGYVAAWDVTVTAGGQPIPGRAYANYLALNSGAVGTGGVFSQTFIQTEPGYVFRVGLNGLDPFGFVFFSNSKGFRDAAGNSLFRSINLNPPTPPNLITSGILLDPSGNADNLATNDVTFKVFFNKPSADLPEAAPVAGGGTTWLRRLPPPIPTISNLQFVGVDGTPNTAGFSRGGTFSYDLSSSLGGTSLLTIDINQDGEFGNENDRVLKAETVPGTNTIRVPWDGNDGLGVPIPVSNTPYQFRLSFFVGDLHFPFLDAENNTNGLIVERINPTTGVVESSTVFYDDSDFLRLGLRPKAPTNPKPISALDGIPSSSGAHGFRAGFGNDFGIDTWTSLVDDQTLRGIISIQKADLSIVKTDNPDPVETSGPLTYTLAVTSNLPPPGDIYSPVKGATVTDIVPADITSVNWTCTITAGTGACRTPSGTGNNINLLLDLDVGATATITINGIVSPLAIGPLNNTASVGLPPDFFDPNLANNQDPEDTSILPNPVQPAGTKSVRLAEDRDNSGNVTTGDILQYTVTYANTTPNVDVTDFLAKDTIDSEKVSFVPGSYTFTATGAGTTVTANPNYNGTTDTNLNTIGTLGRAGGRVTMTYQVEVKAAPGAEIRNQSVATSKGGTIEISLTDAVQGSEELPQIADDGIEQGNLPSVRDDEPTIVKVEVPPGVPGTPRLRLVKRITSVRRNGVPLPGINFDSFVDDNADANDNAPGWSQLPQRVPVGILKLGEDIPIESGDEVEYTVYFLSDGSVNANGIRICDPIPEGTTFIPDSFAAGQGLVVNQGGTETRLTNGSDTDLGAFFPRLNPVTSPCPNTNNPNGSVFFNLGNIPTVAPGNVGFIRFRVGID